MDRREYIVAASAVGVTALAGCLNESDDESTDRTAPEGGTPDPENLPDVDELLNQVREDEGEIEDVTGIQTTTITDGNEQVQTVYELWEQPPDRYRMELVESDQSDQFDVIVSNGEITWLYHETRDIAVQIDLGLGEEEVETMDEELFEELFQSMESDVTGTETVVNREAYVVEFTATGPESIYESAEVWIDTEQYYVLKQETKERETGITSTIELEEVAFNEGVGEREFTFEPPATAEVLREEDMQPTQFSEKGEAENELPFDLPRPDVPNPYQLNSVLVQESVFATTAAIQYTDRAGELLLVDVANNAPERPFEIVDDTVDIGPVEASVTETQQPNLTSIEWEYDGLHYSVSGELERDILVGVAQSIYE